MASKLIYSWTEKQLLVLEQVRGVIRAIQTSMIVFWQK